MRLSVWTLGMILLFGLNCRADTESAIRKIQSAIHNRQFKEAVELIDSQLSTSKEEQDFLLYLKGLSLFYNDSFAEAINCCDEVVSKHEKSAWYRKAVFLKAQCLIQLKQFEEAERIYSAEATPNRERSRSKNTKSALTKRLAKGRFHCRLRKVVNTFYEFLVETDLISR